MPWKEADLMNLKKPRRLINILFSKTPPNCILNLLSSL